jgi:O-Antigen ligase
MTTDLQRSRQVTPGVADGSWRRGLADAGKPRAAGRRRHVGRLAGWRRDHPEWPIVALLASYPLWWALGVADYMTVVLAVPMVVRMMAWQRHGSRKIRAPRGFGIWLLFLVCMLAGVVMLGLSAPDTVASSISSRLLSYTLRAANYLAVTVLLLYAANLTESELPRRRLAWLLGLLAIYTVVGGVGGVLMPSFQFTSPFAYVIPRSMQTSAFVFAELHPGLSQVQSLFGSAQPRPKAPFDYTNYWGAALSVLAPWLLVAWWTYGTRRQRLIAAVTLVVAVVPLVYSLDRGAWIGIALSVLYLAVRMAARGKLALLAVLCAGLVLIVVAVMATPLQGLITQRLQGDQGGDRGRTTLSITALEDGLASPVLGYGDTRHQRGTANSIAIGPTAACPTCGYGIIGSNGQLWLLLVSNGIFGAILYLGFFAYGAWRYRRDTSLYGLAGVLVLLLTFVYMVSYDTPAILLAVAMLSYAQLSRNDRMRRGQLGGTAA